MEDGVQPSSCKEDSNAMLTYCTQVLLSCIESRAANEPDRSHNQRHTNKLDDQWMGRTNR